MKFLLLTALFTLSVAHGAEKDPRPQMHALAQEISALQRYLLSESQFVKPENEKAIQASIDSLGQHVKGLEGKSGPFAQDPARRTNVSLLSRHLTDVSRTFRSGNKPFARYMLQSSLSMCIACHTTGKSQLDFALPEKEGDQASPLERADFLFATRQFEKGKDLYEKVVDGYPDNRVSRIDLQKALNALAVYYVRVKEDPKAGAKYFKVVAKESWLSDNDQKQFAAWAKYLEGWSREKKPALKTEADYLAAAKKLLKGDTLASANEGAGDEYPRRLRASALLHHVLEAPGGASPAKGEALLYLGQLYQRLNHHLFFRFGEMYLKACVEEYPKSKVGQECYGALERAVKEGYTGSAGTEIPADEKAELQRWKEKAF